MTATHTCPNCGYVLDCDNRLMGVGRRKPRKRGPNHDAIQDFLSGHPGTVYTVSTLRAALNTANVRHQGSHDNWWDEDVQNTLSDLVGMGVVEMSHPIRGKEWRYQIKTKYIVETPKSANEAVKGFFGPTAQ